MTAAPVVEETTEEPATPEREFVQPADVVDEETIEAEAEAAAKSGQMEKFGGSFGALALDPRQKELTTEQKLALVAIGIDTANDPQIVPHVRPFIHMCQTRGLDPFRREAYLIGRGEIGTQWRKFTMQVAIDGYRNMAQGTGRLSRVSERLWTGQEDDDSQWFRDARGIMRRVWWDAWPDAKGIPGMAKVIVEHYDEQGRLTDTEAEANWEMYAPYTPKYEGSRSQGNRRKAIGPDGQPVMELGEFWQKGRGHMLSKCSEALAYRTAFPGAMAGMYLHEEMHQADAAEERRLAAIRGEQRRAKVIDLRVAPAQGSKDVTSQPMQLGEIIARAQASATVPPTRPQVVGAAVADVVDAEVVETPEVEEQPAAAVPDIEAEEEPTAAPVSEEQRRAYLLDELGVMAKLAGTTVPALTRRWVATYKRNADDPRTTADELLALVVTLRPAIILAMRRNPSLVTAADTYAQVAADQCGPVEWLFGGQLPDAP